MGIFLGQKCRLISSANELFFRGYLKETFCALHPEYNAELKLINCEIAYIKYITLIKGGSSSLQSKALVCGRSPAEIVGLNPTEGIDVCLL
jgi:hypothetical protein